MADKIIKFAETLANLVNQRTGTHVRKKFCADVGISESLLSQYATGKARPRLEMLCLLAKHLDVSLDHLVYGDGEPQHPPSAPGIESHPLYGFIDSRLEMIGARAEEKSWALFKVAEIVARKMDKIADRMVGGSAGSDDGPGRINDQESLYLERCASSVQIFATDFSYDIIEKEDGTYVPGKFFPIVKQNILGGCQYQFILPKGNNWAAKISAFQNLLRNDVGDIGTSRCQFRIARRTFISGIGILHIRLDVLRQEQPVLYYALSEYSLNDCIAYIIPPSTKLHGDLLISRDKIEITKDLFREAWDEADHPAQVETPRRRRVSGGQ